MNNFNRVVEMVIGEYLVKCPNCMTEVKLMSEMVSPIMIYCKGCGRSMVIINNTIFTLPFDYVYNLMSKYKVRSCGNVIGTSVSKNAKQLINQEKIEDLQQLLSQSLDVRDFIKRIDE